MRRIVLCCALSVAFLISAWGIVAPSRAASTIVVTTTADTLDNADGLCSLREAILSANTDNAVGGCSSGSGADTIEFDPGLALPAVFVLTRTGANEDGALTGDLDISGTLTIRGAGQEQIIVDGNATDRAFEIRPGARVTLNGLAVQHGNPGIGAGGGGIAVDATGILTLTHSLLFSNTAANGGGLKVSGILRLSDSLVQSNAGGGLRNEGGSLTLNRVDILSNTGGYGIDNNQGPLTFDAGWVMGNQGGIYNANNTSGAALSHLTIVANAGSGVYNSGASSAVALNLRLSTVMSNAAPVGAGVYNDGIGASMSIYNTRIAYNVASASAGGAWNFGAMAIISSTVDHNRAPDGAGIRHNKGNLYLSDDTISFNTATGNGGGLYSEDSATLINVTIDSNRTQSDPGTGGNLFIDNASMSLKNTIISGGGAEGNCGFNLPVFLTSGGHNLDSDATCGLAAAGDISNTNPLLGPLQDNGGATPTQALLPGSPAIDQGTNAGCPAGDQRGLPRPQGASCDIGAYELGSTPGGYTLTIAYAGNGVGSVIKNPDFATYLPGAIVNLTATADAGSAFAGWSGATIGAAQSISLTMDTTKTVTATFVIGQAPIADAGQPQTVKSNSPVSLDGGGSYDPDDNLPLSYGWQQINGAPALLDSVAVSRPIFTAPGIVTQPQALTFSLVVTDSMGLVSAPAQVIITVEPYRSFLPVVTK